MKVLVPLDITQPAEPTVEHIVSLLDLKDAEVRLLYVKEALPAYENVIGVSGDFAEDWDHRIVRQAESFLGDVKEKLSLYAAHVSIAVVSGPAAMMIETVSREERCDVTVITPGKHSAIARFFLGTVTGKVVRHGSGTVLIIRPPAHGGKPALSSVVIGLDGSTNSMYALEKAISMFGLAGKGVKVTLVHAVAVADALKLVSPVEFMSQLVSNLMLEGETFLADGRRVLAENGVETADIVLKEGDPSQVLLEVADSAGAELVVTGARGRSGVQHFLLGSVSHRVATHAPCTVAVVKMEEPK